MSENPVPPETGEPEASAPGGRSKVKSPPKTNTVVDSMKRIFDLLAASVLLLCLAVPMLVIALAVKLTSRGPVLYWSNRVGRNNRIFAMPKFRTMRIDTPQLPSHLLEDPESWLTPIGGFLRRTSLDEFPQLFSILKGEMSLVGPRPALYNQTDLIELRTEYGVHEAPVGLTGWAQINGRDESPLFEKVAHDVHYLQHRSFWFDLKILALTAWKVLRQEGTDVPTHLAGHANSQPPTEPAADRDHRRAA